jgi:hypothetical protein
MRDLNIGGGKVLNIRDRNDESQVRRVMEGTTICVNRAMVLPIGGTRIRIIFAEQVAPDTDLAFRTAVEMEIGDAVGLQGVLTKTIDTLVPKEVESELEPGVEIQSEPTEDNLEQAS